MVFDGAVVRLRDAKGLRHLVRLLTHPGREFHTLDLEAAEADPALGRHRAATVRTGRYCSYTPDPRLPITWER